MKVINEHIKSGEYKNVYLLYGEEEYLKKQYRDKLKNAIIGTDTMNYSYYEGDKISVKEILDIADTMPFFSEHRLVIVENSGFFKSSNEELADFIRNIPEYLIMVFVEKEVDKRNKVYKAVSENGYISEMKPQTTATLGKWIVGLLKNDNKKITKEAVDLLLSKTGAGMDLIKSEIDKLVSYCADKELIEAKDVESICQTVTVSRIFDMIAAIATKKQNEALSLYYDLLTLKEPPMRILYLLSRQFNGILQVKEMQSEGLGSKEIASRMGVAPFIAGKYLTQTKYFTFDVLHEALEEMASIEENVKQGKIEDKLGVELAIVKYSSKNI